MRVMVFVKASENSAPPTAEAFEAMDRFTEELVKAGLFVAAAGLKNGAQAKPISFDGPRRMVIDGPFAESKELIAGFSIWEVKDSASPDLVRGRRQRNMKSLSAAAKRRPESR